jgi:hypothetical protein
MAEAEGSIHIYRPDSEHKAWPYCCPECGSATYLGIFIPTVEASFAEWHGWSFKCHNLSCDPLYEESIIDWDRQGEPCEPRTVYDLIDSGDYWASEDDCYYTPNAPRE